ncbi:MAG: prolipoprotein diacylglyceryl transferase [marine bacterium B5-7]|nr:MAG: prolipoprotein diacylglyceryl transferase [marine bacterium B5-7]
MFIAPDVDPIAFSIGPLSVRWYGLMYLIGFLTGGLLGVYRARKPGSPFSPSQVWDLLFYIAVGVIVGGRLGYALFYQGAYYFGRPWEIFYVWTGGMSFHGGLIGVLVAMILFARHNGKTLFEISDFAIPLMPPGLLAGRIGNFINQELWGRVTDVPWGVIFPVAGDLPRHPSQLYEACLEGLILFVVLWWYSSKPRKPGAVGGLFLVGYGISRFLVEFVREPDAFLGAVAFGWMSMGQLLSLPMIVVGLWLLLRRQNS